MKVICKQTTSKGFDLAEVTTVFSNDFDYTFGGYGIELNREYLVMGIVLYNDSNCLYYLIDVNGRPDWFPNLLFDVSVNLLPEDWFVKINRQKAYTDVSSIWGFNELCNIDDYYHRLIEREDEAMSVYFMRKIEREQKDRRSSGN